MTKYVYLLACIIGTILPLSQFIPWLFQHGLDFPLLIETISQDPLSSFAWLDVLTTAPPLLLFMTLEIRRLHMPRAWLSLLGLPVGLSLVLPLFLWIRAHRLEIIEEHCH